MNTAETVLATAIPYITSDFHRIDDVSWYGSAYLLTEMAFQPTFGKIYTLFDARITYLVSIVICKHPSQLSRVNFNLHKSKEVLFYVQLPQTL
jgi:MFS family permease